MISSCLFEGKVVHVRRAPMRHRLAYSLFMGLFDLDELPALARRTWLFGYNRPGLFSFHDRDHGDGSGRPLRAQVEEALARAGIEPPGGAIRMLCMPRVMGYVFNPLSVCFCHDHAGHLRAILHEVNNTFGERHFYALRANVAADGRVRQACEKAFRVSPFLPMNLAYHFTITPPGDRVAIHIAVAQDGVEVLSAWFAGKRRRFSSASLISQLARHPAMTWKVIAGIHWEALFIWAKLRLTRRRASSAV
ncbi:MAG: DUF1365 family protein [Novosphingobium sp.]|nr:DUF1365 family protein [Novosphingobium sp.]